MNPTLLYTLIQSFYWATYCLMYNYAASFLQDKGLSATAIGLIFGAAYGLAAFCQPLFAGFLERKRIRPARGIACVYAASIVLCVPLLFGIGFVPLSILFTVALTLQGTMQSSVNALAHRLKGGINFGLARGIGSAVFSLTALLTGQALRLISSARLPLFYMTTMLALVILLNRADRISTDIVDTQSRVGSPRDVLRYTPFLFFLLGVVCVMTPHMFLDCFMLRVMQNVGGGNSQLGIAVAIASATELPAMILYMRLRKRVSCAALIGFSGIVWVFKHLLTTLAPSPEVIFLVQLLQCGCYAIYVPAGVEFVGIALPEELYMQGQALIGTAFALGCMPATLLGGPLVDAIDLTPTMFLFEISVVAGAVFFMLAAIRSRQEKG